MSDRIAEGDQDERRKLVANEQGKLVANLMNTLASGSVLAGLIIPTGAIIVGMAPAGFTPSAPRLVLSAIIWLSAAFVLHYTARNALKELKP